MSGEAQQLTICEAEGSEGEVLFRLEGCIDENADLSPLGTVKKGTMVIDLSGVERINSVGVGEWIRAMKTVPKDVLIFWEQVSTPMVMQLNMIANFHGRSRVRSFFAPYYCPSCDREHRKLLTVERDLAEGLPVAPRFNCPECQGPLDFDDIEEDFLGALLEALELAEQSKADDQRVNN